jgi:hypothetical protein
MIVEKAAKPTLAGTFSNGHDYINKSLVKCESAFNNITSLTVAR